MNSKLLEKFYRNECTTEEVKEVLQWFRPEQPRQREKQEMQATWEEAEDDKQDAAYKHDADKIFKSIMMARAAAGTQATEDDVPVRQLTPNILKKFLRIAAAILLPLCCVWLLAQKYSRGEELVTVETQLGVKKIITLADGSVVKLHSGSSLTYPKHFGDTRELTLKGEAFFEVAKDSLRPFIVHTGKVSTQALGTSFNISYENKDSTISIALATGLVKVAHNSADDTRQLALLQPGQQLIYHKQAKSFKVSDFDREKVLSWKEGVLHFNDASLSEVVEELERWYGVQIKVESQSTEDSATRWHYTGKYDQQSLEAVLQGISFVKKISYRRSGDGTIILLAGKKP